MKENTYQERIDRMSNTNKTNDGSFIVRAPKEDIKKFNEVVKKNAANRAELFRKWMRKYIKENE